jgi:DNA repair photolyase
MKPILNPIYKPEGRAGEYWEYVLNIYATCNHACTYCYARAMYERWHGKGSFNVEPTVRNGLIEGIKKQLSKGEIVGKLIGLCDMCDPYPKGYDSMPTRKIIEIIKNSGNHVQILTKNGTDAMRDFDLLDSNDRFGITYAGYNGYSFDESYVPKEEPYSGTPHDRLAALKLAHSKGVFTWVSCEPVLNAEDVLNVIQLADYVDLWKIGKLNYHPSNIDWKEFGKRAEMVCKSNNRNYCIKDGLRKIMYE